MGYTLNALLVCWAHTNNCISPGAVRGENNIFRWKKALKQHTKTKLFLSNDDGDNNSISTSSSSAKIQPPPAPNAWLEQRNKFKRVSTLREREA